MMKVAIYIPSLRGGGAERVMVTVANELSGRQWSVDLVLATAAGPYLSEVSERVRIVDLKSTRVIKSVPALSTYLRTWRPDTLLAAMSHANMAASMAHWLARSSAKLVLSERSMPSRMKSGFLGTVMIRTKRWAYGRADKLIAVSEGCADELVELIGAKKEKVEVIYNPLISRELFEMGKEPFDHPWFQPGQPPVILGVGRLVDVKGFDVLIRAFAHVRRFRRIRLVILGEGALRSDLFSLARALGVDNDLLMPGFVTNPFPWMKHCSVFVLSSRVEGMPGALIQARVLGAKVVSTNCSTGPREAMEDGRYALFVDVGSVTQMAAAIVRQLESTSQEFFDGAAFQVENAIERFALVLKKWV